ncbi:MAG: RagB/SusD family nutrient uptake outer membrane protein [Ginsengibacter sp.]
MKKEIIKISINTIIIVLMLSICTSCEKFLAKKSDSTLIVPSTVQDLQQLLDDAEMMNYEATPSMSASSTDDYFIPAKTLQNLIRGYKDIYFWHETDLNSINDWSICYEKVYNCNLCLERLKDIKQKNSNSAERNNVKGSALFFRSYYFLQLVWNYANAYDNNKADEELGIALRTSSDFNIPSVRATLAQTYSQIIKDSKESLIYLPKSSAIPTRPSKCAAFGLLARTFLSMRDYKNALLYADSALQINNQLINFNGDEDIIAPLSKNVPFKKFNKEIIFYSEMNKQIPLNRTNYKGRIDTFLFSYFNEDDLRKKAYFAKNVDGYEMFKANYTGSIYAFFTGIATDEMYLIRAEGYLRTGNLEQGLQDLNTLLKSRWKEKNYIPIENITIEEALKMVLIERRKELLMRGLRWMDIKRLNKEGAKIIPERIENGNKYFLQPNSPYYALPLPEDIIRITGMSQNPK